MAHSVPFKTTPGQGLKRKPGPWVELKLPHGFSDGMPSKWPGKDYRDSDKNNYLIKLAEAWADRRGDARPDVNYYLDRLPDGYGCFEITQPGGSQVYKRLFGHPSGKYYTSIVTFSVHFFWLLDGRKGQCECVNCGNHKHTPGPPRPRNKLEATQSIVPPYHIQSRPARSRLPAAADDDRSSRSQSTGAFGTERTRRTARQTSIAYAVDEEGTKDVWREALKLTEKAKDGRNGVEDDIKEHDSIDWVSEEIGLSAYLTQINAQHSFIPRVGELVLWCPSLPEECYLLRDPETQEYRCYDWKMKTFIGFPRWRAGVVAAVPSAAANIDFPDILDLPDKKTSLNQAGFRIETFPDPNNDLDKSLSKQYKYVPLRNIRPMSHWQLLLKGIPQALLSPSILHALTCMTSISVVSKWRWNADWRNGGFISAKGVHLGSELITIGDTVRLIPEAPETDCTDVMIVDHIRLQLRGFKQEHIGPESDSTPICSTISVTFLGQAFTTNIARAWSYPAREQLDTASQVEIPKHVHLEEVKHTFRPVGTNEYGSWWPLHDPRLKKFEVSYDQVLGRLYEADAVRLWSGQRQHKYTSDDKTLARPDLGFDMAGIVAGRRYATQTDMRIPEPPADEPGAIRWLISDHRAQALGISSLNGLEVAAYHDVRTLLTMANWRAHIKISQGEKPVTEVASLSGSGRSRRPKYTGFFNHLDFPSGSQEAGSSQQEAGHSGKRRGRRPGSKLIDGKIYTAAQLAELNLSDVLRKPKPAPVARTGALPGEQLVEVEDISDDDTDEGDELEITETQPLTATPLKHSSHMAGAAMQSTDEDELSEESDETSDATDADDTHGFPGRSSQQRRPLAARLAAYGGGDPDEEMVDDNDDDDNPAVDVGAWRPGDNRPSSSRSKNVPPTISHLSQPLSKSQIMQSAARSTMAQYDVGDEDSSVEEQEFWDLEDWQKPEKYFAGAPEESEEDDYEPESQEKD